jgi:hypothetical protein
MNRGQCLLGYISSVLVPGGQNTIEIRWIVNELGAALTHRAEQLIDGLGDSSFQSSGAGTHLVGQLLWLARGDAGQEFEQVGDAGT